MADENSKRRKTSCGRTANGNGSHCGVARSQFARSNPSNSSGKRRNVKPDSLRHLGLVKFTRSQDDNLWEVHPNAF